MYGEIEFFSIFIFFFLFEHVKYIAKPYWHIQSQSVSPIRSKMKLQFSTVKKINTALKEQ